jgi:hypothetical protein
VHLVWLGIFALVILSVIFLPNAFAQSTPQITLDQPTYTWTERVFIEIKSSSHAGAGSIFVDISTKDYSLDNYKLTAESSGVFTGQVRLTGFEHDAYGDGSIATQPKTSGTGPKNGFLQTERDDTLTVMFDDGNSKFFKSSNIAWNLGEFQSDVSDCLPAPRFCEAFVKDPDMNLNPDSLDHLYEITMFSDTDPSGIDITMVETGDDTGIFSWHISTITSGISSGSVLLVSPGDNITIKYVDNTPPKPSSENRPIDVVQNSNLTPSTSPPPPCPPDCPDFDKYRDAEIEKDGATIIFPENLDVYFPAAQGIYERLQSNNILDEDQYDLHKSGYENNDEIVITQKLVINIENNREFLDVFELDPRTNNIPFTVEDTTIDNNYLNEKVSSYLESCSQNNQNHAYCELSHMQIKNSIIQKTGTHTISESIILKKISTLDEDSSFGDESEIKGLIPITYPGSNENIQEVIYSLSESNEMLFLNGFTLGYGFEKSWLYEFSISDMVPISIDTHLEFGLGIGLRIPIEVVLGVESAGEGFTIDYMINTKDLSNEEYEELLGPGQGFNGKEFKMYLGPKLTLKIIVLDDIVYNEPHSIFTAPKDSDFRPPLDNGATSPTISSYEIQCEYIGTCFSTPIGTIGLSLGSRVDMSGQKVTLTSSPVNSLHESHTHEFSHNDVSKSFDYDIVDIDEPYGTEIKDLKYYSDLHFVPRAKIGAELVVSWLLPFDLSTGWIDFPAIRYEDIVFEKHEGTLDNLQFTPDSFIENGGGSEKEKCEAAGNTWEDGVCKTGCLIATASYGSAMAPQVQQLREIRDNHLLKTESGAAFMGGFNAFYYSFAPTVAGWENDNPVFKEVVRAVITPLITSLSLLNYVSMDSEAEVLGYGLSLIILNLGMYAGIPAIMIIGIRKKRSAKLEK